MTVLASKKQWTIPGPKTLPAIGRTIDLFQFARDSIGYSSKLFQKYGQIVSLATAKKKKNLFSANTDSSGIVLAYGADLVRQVSSQHDVYYKYPLTGSLYELKDKSPRTAPLKRFLVGLFGVNEEKHLQQRKLMMPAFHKQKIDSYRDCMVAIAKSELDSLEKNGAIELNQFMQRLTLRIATKTLFGEDIDTKSLSAGEILQNIITIQENRSMQVFPFDFPGFPFHSYLNLLGQFEEKMRAIIADKKNKGCSDPDLLSMLIEARYEESNLKLTEDELIGHSGVIFAAGHETTANALTWTLFLLSQHPRVSVDLLDELESVLNGEPPSVEQLQHLPLLDRVVKESMRILPSVPWNGRVTSKTTELQGHTLPRGTGVLVSIYHTHHSSEIYSDPESFKPERWETIKPTPYEYNPFSAGPRICIGAGFAIMEIKLILAIILQQFRLEFLGSCQIDRAGLISIKPKYGMPMMVYPQDRQFDRGVGIVKGNVREMVNLPD